MERSPLPSANRHTGRQLPPVSWQVMVMAGISAPEAASITQSQTTHICSSRFIGESVIVYCNYGEFTKKLFPSPTSFNWNHFTLFKIIPRKHELTVQDYTLNLTQSPQAGKPNYLGKVISREIEYLRRLGFAPYDINDYNSIRKKRKKAPTSI
ncbi:hypothetical protein PGT21_030123 [Puccinia graminis f. sp. tritici]|uniref:Uncharacterized protein n=1 Tax=Puccinia graminis f. sp. tritici TaxID=56615 RepID=A0A5B0Q6Z2_PUCGR|nr:hypothetical protein PGT21_030123 [Puccinia graminis f. sp. tritici]